MANLLRMPGVSADADEATLLEWAVAEGGQLSRGDVVATLETDKANVDIESDKAGVVWRLLVEPGSSVAVGSPIAVLLGADEQVDDEAALLESLGLTAPPAGATTLPEASQQAGGGESSEGGSGEGDPGINVLGTVSVGQMDPEVAAELGATDDRESTSGEPVPGAPSAVPSTTATPPATGSAAPEPTPGARVFASPIARRLARENGLSTEGIAGSGPGGRIVRADIERELAARAQAPAQQAEAPPAAPAPAAPAAPAAAAAPAGESSPASAGTGGYTDVPHTGMRRAVAAALTASKQAAPHFYLTVTCRVDELLALRETVNASGAVRVSINDFLVKAVAKSLRDFPEMNVRWTDDAVRHLDDVDVAVAVATDRGLVTPVLRRADTLTLTQVSTQVRELAARAGDGKLKQHELEGGTFTVSNLGMHGVESFAAIINPPQVGILAVGAVQTVPVVVDGGLEVGRTVSLTVSADHRPVDGVLAARWLQLLKNLIETPLSILV